MAHAPLAQVMLAFLDTWPRPPSTWGPRCRKHECVGSGDTGTAKFDLLLALRVKRPRERPHGHPGIQHAISSTAPPMERLVRSL